MTGGGRPLDQRGIKAVWEISIMHFFVVAEVTGNEDLKCFTSRAALTGRDFNLRQLIKND